MGTYVGICNQILYNKYMKKFDSRLNNIPASLWTIIAKIDELKGRWTGGLELSPIILGRLKKSVLVTSTGASTRIEGSKLSDNDIEKLITSLVVENLK